MRGLQLLLAATLLAVAAGPLPAPAAEIKESKAARLAIAAQLRSRDAAERAAAVRRLAESPDSDAVKLVVQTGLGDRSEAVRRAAFEALLTWKDDREACDFILKTLEREIHGKRGDAVLGPLIGVLLASEADETNRKLAALLEGWLAKSKDAAATTIATVADAWGDWGDAQSLVALEKLAGQKAVFDLFPCRRAIVQALIHIRRPAAIDVLIRLLPRVNGEVRGDIIQYLEDVSGARLGDDAAAWQAWWKKQDLGEFTFPPQQTATTRRDVAPAGEATYYGLPLRGRSMVFVIDISSSMAGQRIEAAKRELTSAIGRLADDVDFGIVAFSTHVGVWRRGLARATPMAKADGQRFVYQLRASGKTAAYDALDTALRFDAEAVYFLSDGEPTTGKIVAQNEIVSAITQANRARRMSLYTIGIAPGSPSGPMEMFMKGLAEKNLGQYRRVEE